MPHRTASRRAPLKPRQGGATGAAPGTVDPGVGHRAPVVHVLAFGPEGFVEQRVGDVSAIGPFLEAWPVTWINVDGLGDADLIRGIGRLFGLHALALEDVVHVHQRPKVEDYGDHEYVVIRMPEAGDPLKVEQISIFFGKRFVLTFQERAGDCLEPLRRRLREGLGRARTSESDYLAYAVIDTVIDAWFPVLEQYGERLERLEDVVVERPDRDVLGEIHDVRHDLLELRRAVHPLRDAIAMLSREESPHVSNETRLYLRDCADHAVRLNETIETWRELTTGLLDIYLSAASHRMNEVMQVLTILGAIFIPLTFVAGVYGMNFDHMPELRWRWGYPVVLLAMTTLAGVLLAWFRRRKWL